MSHRVVPSDVLKDVLRGRRGDCGDPGDLKFRRPQPIDQPITRLSPILLVPQLRECPWRREARAAEVVRAPNVFNTFAQAFYACHSFSGAPGIFKACISLARSLGLGKISWWKVFGGWDSRSV